VETLEKEPDFDVAMVEEKTNSSIAFFGMAL